MYIFGPFDHKKNLNKFKFVHPIIVFESHSILKKEKRNQKLQVTITFTLIMTLCKLLTTAVRPVFEML